jgi:hypothetical protein
MEGLGAFLWWVSRYKRGAKGKSEKQKREAGKEAGSSPAWKGGGIRNDIFLFLGGSKAADSE